ncbi:MAG: type II toxin-antitoxin system VapC family toxin [Candidatus Electronema sp. V4]|uniref:type II toxin-antitoxin system VapC family toxin n=1 Tax=Candidatus Electronema sp. V4 TaxID=3454756 RepID=UPI0040558558
MGKMTLLLDTHIFLWWLFDDSRLPAGIRRAVEDADNAVLISAASVWEITTKFRLGKLPEAAAVAKNVPLWIEKAGFAPLAVSPAHAQLAGAWKQAHRDPFDRMLAAQAKLERAVLATVDDALAAFPIQIMSR